MRILIIVGALLYFRWNMKQIFAYIRQVRKAKK
jgi:hypothetical protein